MEGEENVEGAQVKKVKNQRFWTSVCAIALFIGFAGIVAIVAWIKLRPDMIEITKPKPKSPKKTLKEELQQSIGPKPVIYSTNFTNWSKNIKTENVYKVSPSTLDDVKRVLKAAKTYGLQVRFVGTAHSSSPLFADSGNILLETTKLLSNSEGLGIKINAPAYYDGIKTVTVMTGIKLMDLRDFLMKRDLQLMVAARDVEATIGGIISTASFHGNPKRSTISETIVAMSIVDSAGNLRSFNAFQNSDVITLLQTCMGLCGLIYEATLQVEPLKASISMNIWSTLRNSLMNSEFLRTLVERYSAVSMCWAPVSNLNETQLEELKSTQNISSYEALDDFMWIKVVEEIDKIPMMNTTTKVPPTTTMEVTLTDSTPSTMVSTTMGTNISTSKSETTMEVTLTDATPSTMVSTTMGTNIPTSKSETYTGPPITYFQNTAKLVKQYYPENVPSYSQYPLAISENRNPAEPHTTSFQVLFEEDDNFTITSRLVQVFADTVNPWIRQGKVPMNTMMIRYMKTTTTGCYVCPGNYNNTKGRVLSIEFIARPSIPVFSSFIKEMYDNFANALKPDKIKVQWSNMYPYFEDLEKNIKPSFESQWDAFLDTLDKYRLDPGHIFTNRILKRLFYGA